MTIAACHVSPEGVVLGADSAATVSRGDGFPNSHLDYAQKLFEVGEPESSIGLVTWGIGQIGRTSHRSLAAKLGDRHETQPFATIGDMAQWLAVELWRLYETAYSAQLGRTGELLSKLNEPSFTQDEWNELNAIIQSFSGGYCVAGRVATHRDCEAYQILWGPHMDAAQVNKLPSEAPLMWGVPHMMQRLIFGFDQQTLERILASGKWNGTAEELTRLLQSQQLIQPNHLPIREAIDWVHTIIHTTIRGTKFAKWPHWCGGPVEIAVITTDRPFRWVCHKPLEAAVIIAQESRG